MKKSFIVLLALVLFSSHDMYLKLDTYFLQPNTAAIIELFNGTFDKSENAIDRDRMADASILGNEGRTQVDDQQWSEKDSATILSFTTGAAGTWVAGVSTLARNIEMTAADFNDYLEHDGVLDMLAWRKDNDALSQDAIEKYSKHVKAIFQVGDQKTSDWQTALGYPIEFIPLSNPYDLKAGDELQVQLLWHGKPLANQLVTVDTKERPHSHGTDEHSHDHAGEEEHGHSHGTDEHSHNHAGEEEHGHSHGTDEHSHDHAKEEEHGHSHETDEHSHDHAREEEHGHSHGTDEHSHDHAREEEHGHSHGTDEHSHDHAREEEHGHSHETDEHSHDHAAEEEHGHSDKTNQFRTDAEGVLNLKLAKEGIWLLQTIYLTQSEEPGLTHESNWATLTFELGHGHIHAEGEEHSHSHVDEHDEGGIPAYAYWLGSLCLLTGLFFWFNRKN